MADKIFHLTEQDQTRRLIQAQNEGAALLYALGAKLKIEAATAVDTVKLMNEGISLEVVPNKTAARKIFQVTEPDGTRRLIQAKNESVALLHVIGAKLKIEEASAVDTVKFMGEGLSLEIAPSEAVTLRKRRGSKTDEQAPATASDQGQTSAPAQDNLLNPAPEDVSLASGDSQDQAQE